MLSGAPNPLATEWFRNDATSGVWTQFDGLDIGIRIDASPSSVPEPGPLSLLGLGLAGLAAVRRRRH
jgi:PEP-CTERM motif